MVNTPVIIIVGVIIGLCAAFSGLGGGFMIVPLLIFFGYSAQKAVGTSFLGVLIISISAFLAHIKLSNVDYKVGLLLGAGGIIGAQAGARLVEYVPTIYFKKIFALILICLALYLFFKK
ncbi:MAG: sulfite exporter TauE/SafE family protein [Deltaproteobacteria bacterium]|nr:sulfite exporter TauE/SafE family protein [Deltaproteobacteria bacterium]